MVICYFGDSESIHLVKWATHFQGLGNDVHVISFKEKPVPGVTHHFLNAGNINQKGGNFKVLFTFRALRKLLEKIKPDVLHAHYATSYGITAALTGFHPLVISAWGSDVLVSPQKSFLLKNLLRLALRRADIVTVVAPHMQRALDSLNVAKSKQRVITHGIRKEVFYQTENTRDKHTFTFVSTRHLEPIYNPFFILEAFAAFSKLHENVQLLLVGEGSLKTGLQAYCEENGMQDKVHFLGRQSQVELARTLNLSHVFLTLSNSDGDVVSMVEAMACGCVCIGSDIPANRYWITPSENGFLVPLGEVVTFIETLNHTYKHHQELKAKYDVLNKKIIEEKGNWEFNMNAALKVYHDLLKEKTHLKA